MATVLKLQAEPDGRAHPLDYDRELVFQLKPGESPNKLYRRICALYEDRGKIEQDEEGNVHVMAPTGGESGTQNAEVIADLTVWARRNGRGKVFDSSTTFVLTKRLKLVPDAAWASKDRIYAIPYEQRGYVWSQSPCFLQLRSNPAISGAKLNLSLETLSPTLKKGKI